MPRRKKKAARKASRIAVFHGYLVDATTGARVRLASKREAKSFGRKRGKVLVVDGRACKLQRSAAARRKGSRKKRSKKRAKKRAKKG